MCTQSISALRCVFCATYNPVFVPTLCAFAHCRFGDAGGLWRSVRLPARACDESRSQAPLHTVPGLHVSIWKESHHSPQHFCGLMVPSAILVSQFVALIRAAVPCTAVTPQQREHHPPPDLHHTAVQQGLSHSMIFISKSIALGNPVRLLSDKHPQNCVEWRTCMLASQSRVLPLNLTTACLLSRSINDVEKSYYADGEDAFDMRKMLEPKKSGGRTVVRQSKPVEKAAKESAEKPASAQDPPAPTTPEAPTTPPISASEKVGVNQDAATVPFASVAGGLEPRILVEAHTKV